MNRKFFESFFLYKVILFGVTWLAIFLYLKRAPASMEEFLGLVSYWDTNWFLNTAFYGYRESQPSIQNFPLYPLLIRIVDIFVGNLKLSASLVAQVGSFFAFYFLYRVARLELNQKTSIVAVILFAFYPTAYFLTASYSEPLAMAMVLGCVFFIRTHQYRWGALFALLAVLSRLQSLSLLAGVFAVFALDSSYRNRKNIYNWSWPVIGGVLGLVIYLGINKYVHDDFFYYIKFVQSQFGAHSSWPFKNFYLMLISEFQPRHCPQWSCVTFPAFSLIFLIPIVYLIWKTKNYFDFGYSLGILLLLSTVNLWISHPRYTLMVYPMFIHGAKIFVERKWLLRGYILLSGTTMFILWTHFIWKEWAF